MHINWVDGNIIMQAVDVIKSIGLGTLNKGVHVPVHHYQCMCQKCQSQNFSKKGWKVLYINKHKQIASAVSTVIKFVEQCSQNESLEVGYYLKAVADLGLLELGFEDVQLFLFARKQNVLLNLIGLHYSIFCLAVPPEDVAEALHRCQVSDRQVRVIWFMVGRWFFGFRLPDEERSQTVSLGKLAIDDEGVVLAVLNRGAVHEVLRVQIKSVTENTTSSFQTVLSQTQRD